MSTNTSSKKFPIFKYLIVFIGLLFLVIGFLYKKEITPNNNETIVVIDNFLDKVQYPKVDGLENILLFENNDSNIISIDIRFKAGSALDPQNQDGLTNFLVNAMVMSAGGYSVAEFNKMLEEYSINISTSVNRDSIVINLTTLSYYKSRAFNLLKLILNNPNLGEQEIALTRNNIIAEYNMKASKPRYLVSKTLRENLFGDNSYFREIEGNPKIVSNFNSQMLKDFKQKVITKQNMYVAISGYISLSESEELFKDIISFMPEGDSKFLDIKYITPKFKSKIVSVPFKNAAQSEILIAFPSPKYHTEIYPYAVIFNTFMGTMPDSLLFDNVRNKKGLVYTVSSSMYQDNISNFWLISLGTSLEKADEAIELVKQNLVDLKSGSYDFKNIIIAKNWLSDNDLRYFSNNKNISYYLNQMQFLGYSIAEIKDMKESYNNINQSHIKSVLDYIDLDNLVIIKLVKE